eukprot:gnl/TRDRNA2_/TRDRNA2_179146_c0_seq1.p1 gnl/TRDRNA2_/TRDRNA2_179146_c0~~gnl/TRDRNA2_/TRDRNA2_179146_c0_seq1.p1  ORF type:complete len:341 (+),score=37.59 gnl/TRDRNA2_/TRDRNA2_179146_c0_seq1:94-1116(+)
MPGFVEHQRQQQALKVISQMGDRLMVRGKQVQEYHDLLPKDNKEKPRAILDGIKLVMACFLAYVIQIFAWFLIYRSSLSWTFAIFAVTFLGSLGVAISAGQRRLLFWGAVLCALSSCIAVIVGFLCYYGHLVYYLKYMDMRTYTNVGASQSAYSFNDASMFLFTEDTRLDPLRSVGFVSRYTGETYCVSPIIDSTMSNSEEINYWAVGEGCCLQRSEFHCDDASKFETRSALVLLEPEDIVRPYMKWAVGNAIYPRYERAIKLQLATYNTQAAENVKLLRWSKDPIALRDSFYLAAVQKCTGLTCGYFAIVALLVSYIVYVHYTTFLPRRKEPNTRVVPP